MSEPQDPAFGLKAFSIAGRMRLERERLKGMTETERQWRAQWVKDQELSPTEPKNVPEYYKATHNIFRRLYKDPLYAFQRVLEPFLGYQNAYYTRHALGKSLMTLYGAWAAYYVYKYFSNDFTRCKPIEVWVTRNILYPDDPEYPHYKKYKKAEYYDQGFSKSPLVGEGNYLQISRKRKPRKVKKRPPKPTEPEVICPKPEIEYYTP